jgi:hypothetical protein
MVIARCAYTLPTGYTRRRPVGRMTVNARDTLGPDGIAWVLRAWERFTGGPEDAPHNVLMEVTTPSGIRAWVHDRDGAGTAPMLLLPEDY